MHAELIAVGSELLLFGRSDSNGDWICRKLAALGVEVKRRTIVGDDEALIARAIGAAQAEAPLVIVTGGLGPTEDDLTRGGLARALGVDLRTDPALHDALSRRLQARGYQIEPSATRQSAVPAGCLPIENRLGSAPGLRHESGDGTILVFPGVPSEMKAMFDDEMRRMGFTADATSRASAHFVIGGMAESEVDRALEGLIGITPAAVVTILAAERGVEIHLFGTSSDAGEARAEVARIADEVRRRLGAAIAAEGESSPAEVVGERLIAQKATLAVAESCTGGLLGAALTAVPGASRWFAGGAIVYANALKQSMAGVDPSLISAHGAVSEEVARALAEGIRGKTGASFGIGLTGIAGPDGGSADKPVGTVHIAVASARETRARRHRFGGDRDAIRARSVGAAIDLLRRCLEA